MALIDRVVLACFRERFVSPVRRVDVDFSDHFPRHAPEVRAELIDRFTVARVQIRPICFAECFGCQENSRVRGPPVPSRLQRPRLPSLSHGAQLRSLLVTPSRNTSPNPTSAPAASPKRPPPIGSFGLILDRVCQRHLGDIAFVCCPIGTPVPERAAKAVSCEIVSAHAPQRREQ